MISQKLRKSQIIGAIDHIKIDAKEEFATNFVIASIKANGLYQNKYPLGMALAGPLIASKLVEIAHQEGSPNVAHGYWQGQRPDTV